MKTKLQLAKFFLRAILISMVSMPQYLAAATASEPISPYGNFNIPISKNGVQDVDRKWSAPEVAVRLNTTTCINPFDGEGIVVGICGIGTTAGAYVSIRDTSTVTSDSSTDIGWFYVVDIATNLAVNKGGCNDYPDGIKFSTGLAICNSATGISTSVRYRRLKKVP